MGAHESGMIGEDPRGIPSNLMPYLMKVALGDYPELSVFGGDYPTFDGTGVRDYIHVLDLIDGHLKALNAIKDNQGVNVWNLGSGSGYSVLQIINSVQNITSKSINYKIVDRRPGDVELGWEPKKSLDEMISDSWNWNIKNPLGFSIK